MAADAPAGDRRHSGRQSDEAYWGPIHYLAYTQEGALASGGLDGAIRFWDPATGRLRRSLRRAEPPFVVAANGAVAARSRENSLAIWDQGTGEPMMLQWDAPDTSAEALAVTRDARTLAAGLSNGEIVVWSLPELTVLAKYRSGANRIQRLAFSPDGEILAGFGNDLQVRVWPTRTGAGWRVFPTAGNNLRDLAFHPQGKLLACGMWIPKDGLGTVQIWDVEAGTEAMTFPRNECRVDRRFQVPTEAAFLAAGMEAWDETGDRSYAGRSTTGREIWAPRAIKGENSHQQSGLQPRQSRARHSRQRWPYPSFVDGNGRAPLHRLRSGSHGVGLVDCRELRRRNHRFGELRYDRDRVERGRRAKSRARRSTRTN